MIDYGITGAFLVGIMGAAHCFGMCGGIVGAFSANLPKEQGSNRLANKIGYLLAYNAGRITSYTIAGAIVGGSSAALSVLFDIDVYLIALRIFAGVMMIATGLYIAQLWFGIVHIERLGRGLWLLLKPLANKLIPIKSKFQAFGAGIIWGWLPCGLVYSTLTWSVASGSALQGAKIMLAFGVGTLPALLGAGIAAEKLSSWFKQKTFRMISGILLIGFGLQTLYIAVSQIS